MIWMPNFIIRSQIAAYWSPNQVCFLKCTRKFKKLKKKNLCFDYFKRKTTQWRYDHIKRLWFWHVHWLCKEAYAAHWGFPGDRYSGKDLPANSGDARDAGLIPEVGRSPRVGNGNPLHIPAKQARVCLLLHITNYLSF